MMAFSKMSASERRLRKMLLSSRCIQESRGWSRAGCRRKSWPQVSGWRPPTRGLGAWAGGLLASMDAAADGLMTSSSNWSSACTECTIDVSLRLQSGHSGLLLAHR